MQKRKDIISRSSKMFNRPFPYMILYYFISFYYVIRPERVLNQLKKDSHSDSLIIILDKLGVNNIK